MELLPLPPLLPKHNELTTLIRYRPLSALGSLSLLHTRTHHTHTCRVPTPSETLISQCHWHKASTQQRVCSVQVNTAPHPSGGRRREHRVGGGVRPCSHVQPASRTHEQTAASHRQQITTLVMSATERSSSNKRIPPYKYLSVINISNPNEAIILWPSRERAFD